MMPNRPLASALAMVLCAPLAACLATADDAATGRTVGLSDSDGDGVWASVACGSTDSDGTLIGNCVAGDLSCWDDADCGPGRHCEPSASASPLPQPGTCVDDPAGPCEPIACDHLCPFGYLQDAAGCDLCECAPDPCAAHTDFASCSAVAACTWLPYDHLCPDDGTPCQDGVCVTGP
jgi:antistasin family protein